MAPTRSARRCSTNAGFSPARSRYALLLLVWCGLGCRPGDFDDLAATGGASEADASSEAGSTLDDAGDDAGLADADVDASEDDAEAPDAPSDAAEPSDAAQSADAADAEPADAAPADAGPSTIVLPIRSDRDDALWRVGNGGLEEMLHFSAAEHGSAGYTIEVGVDGEQCRAGLRFALPIVPGSRVLAASLRLQRVGPASNADPGATLRVHVYDSASVGAFDYAHVHQDPAEHASEGLWAGASVGAFHVGESDAFTESEDLSELVQHVVDRPDWMKDGYVGFVLTPDRIEGTQYAQFRDSFGGTNGPSLTITFQAP